MVEVIIQPWLTRSVTYASRPMYTYYVRRSSWLFNCLFYTYPIYPWAGSELLPACWGALRDETKMVAREATYKLSRRVFNWHFLIWHSRTNLGTSDRKSEKWDSKKHDGVIWLIGWLDETFSIFSLLALKHWEISGNNLNYTFNHPLLNKLIVHI